jgi:hypothetical protein
MIILITFVIRYKKKYSEENITNPILRLASSTLDQISTLIWSPSSGLQFLHCAELECQYEVQL